MQTQELMQGYRGYKLHQLDFRLTTIKNRLMYYFSPQGLFSISPETPIAEQLHNVIKKKKKNP